MSVLVYSAALLVLCVTDALRWRAFPGSLRSALGRKGAVFFDSPLPKQQVVRAVSAACGESKIVVEVKRDLFGTGQLIKPSDISLGDCAVTLQNDSAQTLLFETPLQRCRSTLTTVENQLVYNFSLNYNPSAIGNTPIVRTNGGVVSIACRYMRFHNMSSNALKPTWVPYTSTKSAEDVLGFTLRLMNADWSSQRSSNVFYLGDVLNIEASVTQANHQPLRLFVDSCVATLVPDRTSSPRYLFIENHGCLTDAKLTGSNSQFMPRSQDSKLQMKLDAFRFQREARNLIYITCHLKVTPASQSVDPLNKDCYTEGSRWRSVDGSDQVCSCCDSSCEATVRSRYWIGRSKRSATDHAWAREVTLGPLILEDKNQAPPAKLKAQRLLQTKEQKAAGLSAEVVMLAGVVAAVGLVCMAVLGTALYRRRSKSIA